MARLQYHALIFLFASLVFATLQLFNHQTLVDNHHHSIILYHGSATHSPKNHENQDEHDYNTNVMDKSSIASSVDDTHHHMMSGPATVPGKNDANQQDVRLPKKKYDISPNRLIPSSSRTGPDRIPQCLPGGIMDEITYTAIQKIRMGMLENQKTIQALSAAKRQEGSSPKLLCMVYTHEGSHDTYLRAIVDTWAKQCDGFLAVSNVTDVSLGAIRLEFPGGESYSNMWQKVQAMWKYVHDHYIDDFDYFHICGDDTFVIPDNFRMFVHSEQVQNLLNGHMDEFSVMSRNKAQWQQARPRPLLFGFPIHSMGSSYIEQYAGGGCGYTLNREAVRVFYEIVSAEERLETDSREDILVARVLAQRGITCSDTRDANGAFRYMPDHPMSEYRGLHKWPGRGLDNIVQCKGGLDAFSNETISIHLNYRKKSRWLPMVINYTEEIIYRYDDLLSGKCDSQLLSHEPNMTMLELLNAVQRKRIGRNLAKQLEKTFGLPPGFNQMKPAGESAAR